MKAGHRSVHIITFGCQMNEHDSETIAGVLGQIGYQVTDDPENADLIVVNTCTVRNSADEKILGRVGYLNRYKRNHPQMLIAVGGCLSQDDDGRTRLLQRAPHVDIVFGTHNIHQLPELLARAHAGECPAVEVTSAPDLAVERDMPQVRTDGVRAWVNITLGCDNYCSYCIVPHVRGGMRSRLPDAIADEVTALGSSGYKEIFLLGQNVNAYGQDLSVPTSFGQLLTRIHDIPGIARIRFTTSHPRDFSQALVDMVFNLPTVCESFHLPVQSGSDRVLAAMNRGYDRDHYLSLVQHIRAIDQQAGVSTDIIVGFPGETDNDFRQTLDLVRQVEFDQAFTFLYSPRSGTPAAVRTDQIASEIKKERLDELMKVQYEIALRRNQQLVDSTVEVLVEGPSDRDPDILSGRTRSNKIVHFPGPATAGELVSVVITQAMTWTLRGQQVTNTR